MGKKIANKVSSREQYRERSRDKRMENIPDGFLDSGQSGRERRENRVEQGTKPVHIDIAWRIYASSTPCA
jgi:hypothetical protein